MIPATFRLPIVRIARSPRALLPLFAWLALAFGDAMFERRHVSPHAADHALLDVFASLALPLLAYSLVGAMLAGGGLGRATRPLVTFGASPARAALGTVVASALASALLCGAVGAGVAALAHGPSDPPLGRDVLTTLWISALAGAAYAALFAFGSSIFANGSGRVVALALDGLLGLGTSGSAVITPRAHLRNLLGGAPPIELSQRTSAVLLAVLALVFAAATSARARRSAV
jgi:hypothetical protein